MGGVWMKPWPRRVSHREPATREEKLASMRQELDTRIKAYGPEHDKVKIQREAIYRMEHPLTADLEAAQIKKES